MGSRSICSDPLQRPLTPAELLKFRAGSRSFLEYLFLPMPMLLSLLVAIGMFVFGLNIQAIILSWLVERLPRLAHWAAQGKSFRRAVGVVDLVLLHVLVVAMVQIAAWALIFTMVGEFRDYRAAFYHSAVNFTTLGYGDVVMSPPWRLLGPLEALNGVLALSLSGAVLVATFGRLHDARHSASRGNRPSS